MSRRRSDKKSVPSDVASPDALSVPGLGILVLSTMTPGRCRQSGQWQRHRVQRYAERRRRQRDEKQRAIAVALVSAASAASKEDEARRAVCGGRMTDSSLLRSVLGAAKPDGGVPGVGREVESAGRPQVELEIPP